VASIATAFAVAGTPTAANAQSGGGCHKYRDISSCVSYSNTYGRVSGDFYLDYIDAPECTASLYLVINGSSKYQYTVALDHLGRYPEAHYYITSTGSAYTHVETFFCNGAFSYSVNSNVINFP
jgi:hypothetical protein